MSKKDWTQKLQEQMAGYQEPVKDDLWASISQSLAQQDIVKRGKAKRIVMWQRWSAAAAIALALTGGGWVYLHQQQTDAEKLPLAQIASDPKSSAKPLVVESQASSAKESVETDMAVRHSLKFDSEVKGLSSNEESEVLLASAESMNTGKGDNQVACLQTDEAPHVSVSDGEECYVRENNRLKQDDVIFGVDFERKVKANSIGNWNVQLFAENGVFSSQDNNMQRPMMEGIFYASASQGDFVLDENLKTLAPLTANMPTPSKHHAPISVGVQVGIPLAPKLTLSTGLIYTRTSSEFAINGSEVFNKKQVLHYVGVPLGVNYEFWHFKGLHTYVMAGGEADLNVKNVTEVEGEKVDHAKRDRMQFSGKASLGAQVDVTPAVGIYVEPGVKYYFDNGSNIDNSFKDKKLNFNFQFGLRFNL